MKHSDLISGLRKLRQKAYKVVHAEAIEALRQDASDPLAYFLLGVIAFDHKNYSKSLELFQKAEKLDESEPYYAAYLAMTYSILRDTNMAREAADRAAVQAGQNAHLSDMIGVVYSRSGFHEAAIKHFQVATTLNTTEPNYFFNLAASQQFLGDFEAAESSYKTCLALAPENTRAWSSLIALKKQSAEDNHLEMLVPLFEDSLDNPDAKLHIGHAIAKTYEDLGEYEQSLEWLESAKADKHKQLPFDREAASSLFKQAAATTGLCHKAPTYQQNVTPIFIVGLPRTGTTLVDRILSSHSQVTSAGELNVFAELVKRAGKTSTPFVLDAPTFLAAKDIELSKIGQKYLDTTKILAKQSSFMVDKMPLNFFYAALITRAFPTVKIVALRRGAMDSCLSNYRQLFSTQFSYYNYTYNLKETAFFYREFHTLMGHWAKTLPKDRFAEIRYENIVLNQEAETRRLLEFCGLPWEDACLRFHENTAAVSTASSVQVRQPLYSGSIGRWKKYGDKLSGLKQALGDLEI